MDALLWQPWIFTFLLPFNDNNVYPPIFILQVVSSIRISDRRNQQAAVLGEIKKRMRGLFNLHMRFASSGLHADARPLPIHHNRIIPRTYHPLFSRIVHGIINCRRRQLAVRVGAHPPARA